MTDEVRREEQAEPARSAGEACEKWQETCREERRDHAARSVGLKSVEKCSVNAARRVGGADGMVSKYLNNNYFSTTSRCKTTLPVA